MPVAINMPNAGTVILLNRRPTLTMSATSSSIDFVCDFKTGTRTTPIKIEPPTHIEAHMRCTHVTRLSVSVINIWRRPAVYYRCCLLERFLILLEFGYLGNRFSDHWGP